MSRRLKRRKNPSGKTIFGVALLGLGLYTTLFQSTLIGAGMTAGGAYLLWGKK